MSTIQEIERSIEVLPRSEVETLRDWLENFLEDEREMPGEFTAKIERSEREIAEGQGRVHRHPTVA